MADEAHLRALLLKGLAGEEAAHRAFLAEAAALLRGFFRNRLRGRAEDAEDLVQETLVALHTRRDSYDPNYPLTAWMFAIARYRLIDFLRRAKHRAHASLDDGMDVGEIDPDYAASDAKRDLNTLLVKLEEKSVKEAADETGFSESDIKISIHRGMKTLMRLIGEASPT
jgi:RNA polymerase sigma-70 factor (ECF subfamily)